jgi:hypothetical protein
LPRQLKKLILSPYESEKTKSQEDIQNNQSTPQGGRTILQKVAGMERGFSRNLKDTFPLR